MEKDFEEMPCISCQYISDGHSHHLLQMYQTQIYQTSYLPLWLSRLVTEVGLSLTQFKKIEIVLTGRSLLHAYLVDYFQLDSRYHFSY